VSASLSPIAFAYFRMIHLFWDSRACFRLFRHVFLPSAMSWFLAHWVQFFYPVCVFILYRWFLLVKEALDLPGNKTKALD
ncbi:MAG: hypothetical protein AB2693_23730, partial [Candidatus Thiodiazotropha sp.]